MPVPPIPIPIQSPAKLQDPVAAATDPDPYPYYAELVASRPIYWEESTQAWVAASAEAVTAVLTSHLLRGRPAAEPVPKALLGTPAENIFRHLVRMNDGAAHCPFKQAVAATLHAAASVHVEAVGRKFAQRLWRELQGEEIRPQRDLQRIADFALRLPAYVMASLLGIPEDKLPQTAQWTGEFVRCLAPAGSPEEIERGKVAAGRLLDLFRSLFASRLGLASHCGFASQPAMPAGLLATLALEAKRVGEENLDVILANGIGFLTQAYEATAGLIARVTQFSYFWQPRTGTRRQIQIRKNSTSTERTGAYSRLEQACMPVRAKPSLKQLPKPASHSCSNQELIPGNLPQP